MKAKTYSLVDTNKWGATVYLRIGQGMREPVDGPHQALMYLLNRWPAERGRFHAHAKLACLDALERSGSPELAREAFVYAAMEARLIA